MIKTPLSTMIGGAFWTPCATIIGSTSATFNTIIKSLFANSEQGFAYDSNDLTTLYQDAAGTIPITAAGQPVGLVLDKSKGLVIGGELFDDSKAIIATAGSSRIEPNVYKITSSDGSAQSIEITRLPYGMLEIDLEILSVVSGSVRLDALLNNTRIFSTTGKSKFRLLNTRGNIAFVRQVSPTDVTFRINSIKQVLGNHAYQTVSASRPVFQRNATTGTYYLAFDGADDFLQTNNIDFTSTDKMSLFAGVRKLSDVNTGIVAELSTRAGTSLGAFVLYAPFDPMNKGYGFRSVGTLESTTMGALPLSPTSNVLAAKSSIAQDTLTLRVDSLQYGVLTQDQGTGNYGNYPLYIGRRGGTILPFNGHLYSLIGIGRLTTTAETTALEKLIAKNTGVTLS